MALRTGLATGVPLSFGLGGAPTSVTLTACSPMARVRRVASRRADAHRPALRLVV